MKTLKAIGLAALVAASASTAAFARESDAASQTPFLYTEASGSVVASDVLNDSAASILAVNSDDAASETPFLYNEVQGNAVSDVTRGNSSFTAVSDILTPTSDDAASQTPFLYAE